MDSAFLTGGTGFVGASLARLLLQKGLKVKALARKGFVVSLHDDVDI